MPLRRRRRRVRGASNAWFAAENHQPIRDEVLRDDVVFHDEGGDAVGFDDASQGFRHVQPFLNVQVSAGFVEQEQVSFAAQRRGYGDFLEFAAAELHDVVVQQRFHVERLEDFGLVPAARVVLFSHVHEQLHDGARVVRGDVLGFVANR